MNGAPIDRWVVKASLTNLAPLAIRTGEARPRAQPADQPNADAPSIAEVAVDHLGHPYIPATAIKGMLRAIAANRLSETDQSSVYLLFGDLARKGRNNEALDGESAQAIGGAAEIRDAYLTVGNATIFELGQTRIDRKRLTAENALLRNGQFVAPGTRFDLEIVVDRASAEDVQLLAQLLASVDGAAAEARLGGGGGSPVRLDGGIIAHWDKGHIASWLKSNVPRWQDSEHEACPVDWFEPLDPRDSLIRIAVELPITGHFLVSRVNQAKASEKDATRKKAMPDLVPVSPDGSPPIVPYLPKSSLKGALRSQAERICRTLGANFDADGWVGTPVEVLFGTTNRAGLMLCSDFAGEIGQPVRLDMVAIDRLNGGVATGMNLALKAWEKPVLSGTISLRCKREICQALTGKPEGGIPPEIDQTALGLFAMLLRDLGEGDIPLGYGSRKGFGQVIGFAWREAIGKLGNDDEIRAMVSVFRGWALANQKAEPTIAEVPQ